MDIVVVGDVEGLTVAEEELEEDPFEDGVGMEEVERAG